MRSSPVLILSTSINIILTLVLLFLFYGGADHHQQSLTLKSLEITDSTGDTRLLLSVDDQDQPFLRMLNREGVPVLSLKSLNTDGPCFMLSNANGEEQLSLELVNGDLPWLSMISKTGGKRVVSLGLNSYGAPSLEMSDIAGRRHVDIRFDESGYFGFAAYGPEYEDRLRVGLKADGEPALNLFDINEQRIASLEIYEDKPNLTFWREGGNTVLKLPEDETTPG